MASTGTDLTLKRGAIGTLHGVFQSFSFVGPAADVAILLVATVFWAGAATPLAIIIAWLIYGLWMVTPYEFSKHKSNAGSYYAYSASSTKNGALGPVTLFSWMGENLTGQSFGILGLAGFAYVISSQLSAIPYLWILFAVILTAWMFFWSYFGIRLSLNYVAFTGIAELLVLLVGALIIIAKLGASNTLAPFTIPTGGLLLVMFGVTFSILDFTGLGTVTTVSEEITDPKRKVKKSLVIAWLLSGIALIPASYALMVGWGIPAIGSYASSPDPGLIVFGRYLGPIGLVLLAFFTLNSYASYGVAKSNAVSRIWYSAARDGVLFPKSIAKLHPRFKTPASALILWLSISFVLDIVVGLIFGPLEGGFVLLAMAGIAIIFVHVFANTGLTLFSHRELRSRGQSSFIYHYLAPSVSSILGIIIVVATAYEAYVTFVGAPNSLNLAFLVAPILGIIWCVVIGSVLSLYYLSKKRSVLRGAGRYDSGDGRDRISGLSPCSFGGKLPHSPLYSQSYGLWTKAGFTFTVRADHFGKQSNSAPSDGIRYMATSRYLCNKG